MSKFYWYRGIRKEQQNIDTEIAVRLKNATFKCIEELLLPEDTLVLSKCKQFTRLSRENIQYSMAPEFTFKVRQENGTTREGFVCFTDCPYQAMFVGAAMWAWQETIMPYIVQINCHEGSVTIYDNFHAEMGSRLSLLSQIHIYYLTTIFRDNFLGVPIENRPPPNTFTIDTEFVDGKHFYEIAILNMHEPFKSLNAFIECPQVDDDSIKRMGLSRLMFNKISYNTDVLYRQFLLKVIDHASIPNIYYFSAAIDVKWLPKDSFNAIDVANILSKDIITRGTFASNSKAADCGIGIS